MPIFLSSGERIIARLKNLRSRQYHNSTSSTLVTTPVDNDLKVSKKHNN